MRNNYNLKVVLFFAALLASITCVVAQPNFGIDVPSPQEKLDVNGAIRIGNTTNSNAGSIRYSTVSSKFQINVAGTWYDLATTSNATISNVSYNATTNIITITEGSNNFTVNLTDLQDNTDNQAISYNATTNVVTLQNGGTIDLTDLQDNTDAQTLSNVYGQNGNAVTMNATAGDVRFFKVGNEIFTLKESTGNVGIGTNTPNARLQVVESGTGNATQITESSDGDGMVINEAGNGNALTITQAGAGHGATIMGGNVGIGTTNPATELEVVGTTRISTLASGANGAIVKTNTNGDMSISNFPNDNDQILDGTGNWVDINTMVSGDYIENQTAANQAAGFRITGQGLFNGGNVGIGTLTPGASLNVYDPDESLTQTPFTQSINNSGVLVTSDYLNTAYVPGLFWNTQNENPTKPKAGIFLQTNTAGSKMILATSTDYPTGITNNAIVIDQDANVGIGTNSPQYLLDVAGDVNVASGSGYRINGTAPSGQYLRGNGTRFVPAAIAYSDITGTPTTLPPSGAAGGSLAGNYPNPTLAANSVGTAEIANNSIANADLADMAANTLKGNPTAANADPSDFAVNTNSAVGRLAGNITNIPMGTTANTLAWGDHTHSQLHNRSHAMTSTSDHTATAWRLFYSDGSGNVSEMTLGTGGQVLKSNGLTAAPTWQTDNNSGGTVTGTGANGRVTFWNGTSSIASNGNFLWDDVNSRMGIGTTAVPDAALTIYDGSSATQTDFTQALPNSGILVTSNYVANNYSPGVFWNTTINNPTKPKAGLYMQATSGGSKLFLGTSNSYATGVTNNAIVIDPSGSVGINSVSPAYMLDVAGGFRSQATSRIGTGTDMLNFELQGTFHRMAFNELRFWDWTTGSDMVTFNNGNVGIGPTVPNDALDVTGSVDASVNYKLQGINAVFGSATDIYGNFRVLQNNSSATQDGMYINYNSTGGTAADLRLFANGNIERIRIKANTGYVGIGTNNPAQMLEIYNDNADVAVRFHDPGDYHFAMGIDRSDAGKFKINYGAGVGDANHITMTSSGTVGILTNAPAQALDVAGDINSSNGYRIGNAAASGQYLRGNGTRFVSSGIQAGDIPGGSGNYIQNQYGSAQSANSWVSGTSRADGGMRAPYFTATDYNGGIPGGDGSFYRTAGQAEISVDDWLYLRDANDNGVRIQFNSDDGSIRPYILYDLNNTGYYLNPDGLSNLSQINLTNYFNTDINDSWFPYSSNWNYFRGNTYAWNATWLDENNTGYYVDPNSANRFYDIRTLPGFDNYFPANNAIRMTPNFHFNTPSGYATILNWDNGNPGGGSWQFRVGNGAGSDQFYVRADGQFYGRHFGDLDDGGYYLDPNNTSNSALRIRGGALHGPNPSWGAYLLVGGDGRNGYIDNGNTASISTTNGNLHMDAASGFDMYLNYYDGSNIHFGRGTNSTRATLNGNGLYLYDGWFRPHGSAGVYWESYGGGWYMQDASWVRTYNSKSMLAQVNSCDAAIRGDNASSCWYAGDFRSYNSSSGPALIAYGYIYSTSAIYQYSMRENKRNIAKFEEEDYEDALAFMDDIDLNYYRMKDDEEYPKVLVGLIADEAPATLTAPGRTGIAYSELGIYATGAVKALKRKVNDLEEQISSINDFGAENIRTESMWVEYSNQFTRQLNGADPIVVLTPSQTGTVLNLSEITKTGFKVENPNGKPVTFSWIAMAKIERTPARETYGEKFENMIKSAENDTRPVPKGGPEPAPAISDPSAPVEPAVTEQHNPYENMKLNGHAEQYTSPTEAETTEMLRKAAEETNRLIEENKKLNPEGEAAPQTKPLQNNPHPK